MVPHSVVAGMGVLSPVGPAGAQVLSSPSPVNPVSGGLISTAGSAAEAAANSSESAENLIGIEDVQRSFHPNEVARFARDVLRIKEVTVEVLNSPSTATQQLLGAILDELRTIRGLLASSDAQPTTLDARREQHDQARPAA